MTKKHLYRAFLWLSVLGLMTAIFLFSAQSGAASDEITVAAAMPITELLSSLREDMTEHTATLLYVIVGTLIRKLAHFCEYALLSWLLCLLLRSYGLNGWKLPLLIGVLYAASDELHQVFVPGRSGMVTDVLLDAVGVFFGVKLISIINRFRRKA